MNGEKLRQKCCHWIKGRDKKLRPMVERVYADPSMWKCTICQQVFPIRPQQAEEFDALIESIMANVDQAHFWNTSFHGYEWKKDMKRLIKLKKLLSRFQRDYKALVNEGNKRKYFENGVGVTHRV